MLNSFKFEKDRSLPYLHGEGATSSVENAAIAYQSPSLLSIGASAKEVAILSTITNLLFAILLIKIPSLVKSSDSLKRGIIILGIISVLGWLPLILIPIFFKGVSPLVLIILWVINLVPNLTAGPLTDKWLSDLVSSKGLARYLSIRSIISASAYLSCFYMMGYMLDYFQSNPLNGFSLIYLIAFVASLVTLLLLLMVRVPVGETVQSDFGLGAFIREAKQNNLGTFVIFTAAIIFSSSICGVFFSVYMLRDLHFTYIMYTVVISVEFMARIAFAYVGGKWVDHSGAIRVLYYASLMIPIIPIMWLFSSNLGYLIGIQVLSGIAWATFDLSTQSYLCRYLPHSKRLHYIVYQRSIVTFAAAIGPLVGAGLLNVIFPIFGNPILGIFLLSGVLRFLSLIILLPRLKEAEKEKPEAESEAEEAPSNCFNEPASFEIPLYRSQKADRNSLRLTASGTKPDIKPGDLYRTEQWEWHPARPTESVKENIRQDLLYRSNRGSQPTKHLILAEENSCKPRRLKDNLSRSIEYHKGWASKVPCTQQY